MTVQADVVNLALQAFGSRTTVTAALLATNGSNEAKQANLAYVNTRDSLLRMAPWDCSLKTANLNYISSVPGTPENTSATTTLWQPGQPRPPWAYEYQYPVDCLRACWMIPSTQFGFASGVPITTAVTGGASTLWNGAPITFKVATDQFYPVTGATVQAGGTNYNVGDVITLAAGLNTNPPIGAPAQLTVLTAPGGVIGTVSVLSQLPNAGAVPLGGSYFLPQTNPVAQGSVVASNGLASLGSGATFNLTYGAQASQRVVLTNQEFATMVYVAQTTDPNLWDPLFQDAFQQTLGANLCIALSGDKGLANMCIGKANRAIMEARAIDGNEGLTINDVTPDWIRTRGIWWSDNLQSGPYAGFDWGGILPGY